ncbi:MAG TPA: FtsX-like permease family protein, partial [Pyrinomonadaceae bacterium]|nr:FtsX-like permease family protein [Pyrinomonadaceae bacterium]
KLDTLWQHKLRSFLTVLGVVISTMTVIVIAAFVSGIDQPVAKEIESFAIGARKRDIIAQFLIEAGTLTGVGGLLGIFVGSGLALLIQMLMPTYIPLWAPIVGFGVSVGLGVVFGLWPARKAARLNPIDALRYE